LLLVVLAARFRFGSALAEPRMSGKDYKALFLSAGVIDSYFFITKKVSKKVLGVANALVQIKTFDALIWDA